MSTLTKNKISTYYISSDIETYAKQIMQNLNQHDLSMRFGNFGLILKTVFLSENILTDKKTDTAKDQI